MIKFSKFLGRSSIRQKLRGWSVISKRFSCMHTKKISAIETLGNVLELSFLLQPASCNLLIQIRCIHTIHSKKVLIGSLTNHEVQELGTRERKGETWLLQLNLSAGFWVFLLEQRKMALNESRLPNQRQIKPLSSKQISLTYIKL